MADKLIFFSDLASDQSTKVSISNEKSLFLPMNIFKSECANNKWTPEANDYQNFGVFPLSCENLTINNINLIYLSDIEWIFCNECVFRVYFMQCYKHNLIT